MSFFFLFFLNRNSGHNLQTSPTKPWLAVKRSEFGEGPIFLARCPAEGISALPAGAESSPGSHWEALALAAMWGDRLGEHFI